MRGLPRRTVGGVVVVAYRATTHVVRMSTHEYLWERARGPNTESSIDILAQIVYHICASTDVPAQIC
jgi:hypothetical protein